MNLEIVNLIDEIEDQEYMAEMAVMDALMASYAKEAIMCEYMSTEVVQECFYQEGAKWDIFKDDINAGIKGKQGENILKKILLFIPRLIASFVNWIKNKFSKNAKAATNTAKQAVSAAQSMDEKQEELADTIESTAEKWAAEMPSDEAINAYAEAVRKSAEPLMERLRGNDKKSDDDSYEISVDKDTEIYVQRIVNVTKTTASYIRKNVNQTTYSDSDLRGKSGLVSSLYSSKIDFAKKSRAYDVVSLMKTGKVPTLLNLDNAITVVDHWAKILTAIEKAVVTFDKGNQAKFEKDILTIYKKFQGPNDFGYNTIQARPNNIQIALNGKLMTYPIDEYVDKMDELDKKLDEVRSRAVELNKRIVTLDAYEGDINKSDIASHVSDLRTRNTERYLDNKDKLRDKRKSGEIDKDEYLDRSDKLYEDYINNNITKMTNAYNKIADTINYMMREGAYYSACISYDLTRYRASMNIINTISHHSHKK